MDESTTRRYIALYEGTRYLEYFMDILDIENKSNFVRSHKPVHLRRFILVHIVSHVDMQTSSR